MCILNGKTLAHLGGLEFHKTPQSDKRFKTSAINLDLENWKLVLCKCSSLTEYVHKATQLKNKVDQPFD